VNKSRRSSRLRPDSKTDPRATEAPGDRVQRLQRVLGNTGFARLMETRLAPGLRGLRSNQGLLAAARHGVASPTRAGLRSAEAADSAREVQAEAGPASPTPDDELRLAQGGGGGGSGSGGASTGVSGGRTAPHTASLSIAGDGSYTDNATESRKTVTFNATWSGGAAKEDFIIVNWLKGSMKKPDGNPYKVKMYGSSVDFDFSDWQVDSVDADPAYWSDGGVRWNYSVDAANKFSATDSPGPMYTRDGKGAKAALDFKTAVYKSADVPTTTTGTLSATPLSSFETWSYHVAVLGGGKFSH
jgi:hypothetical protein